MHRTLCHFIVPAFFALLMISPLSANASQSLPVAKPPLFTNFCAKADSAADFQICAQKRFDHASAMLNTKFDALQTLLQTSPHALPLTTAQNAWLEYRAQECLFESGLFDPGMAQRTIELNCLSRLTEARTLSIFTLLENIHTAAESRTNPKSEN